MHGIMSMKRNKQVPLGLTEGERKTLKGFRILPCLWHSWGWVKSVVYSILVYPHQSEGKHAIIYWKKAQSSRGSLSNLKANRTLIHSPVHYKSPAVGGIPAPALSGALTELWSKQLYYLTIHQTVLELPTAYPGGEAEGSLWSLLLGEPQPKPLGF